MYRQLICLAVVLFVGCGARELSLDERAALWAERAAAAAKNVKAADRETVDVAMAVMYARLGDAKQAVAAARRVPEKDLGALLLEFGKQLDEKSVAESIKDHAQREYGRLFIVLGQIGADDLAAAERTAAKIKDRVKRNGAWTQLAYAYLQNGKYDLARRAIARFDARTDGDREAIQRVRKKIAKQEAAPQEPAADRPTDEDLAAARQGAAAADNPENRAYHLRVVAGLCQKLGRRDEQFDALKKAEAAADRIREFPSFRSANLMLIASAYLEAGENDAAIRLAKKTIALRSKSPDSGADDDGPIEFVESWMSEGLAQPGAIAIVALAGDLDAAFELAEQPGEWTILGAACGEKLSLGLFDDRFAAIKMDRDKTLFCTGVVQGILELKKNQQAERAAAENK